MLIYQSMTACLVWSHQQKILVICLKDTGHVRVATAAGKAGK